jgi:hypothetical protein
MPFGSVNTFLFLSIELSKTARSLFFVRWVGKLNAVASMPL